MNRSLTIPLLLLGGLALVLRVAAIVVLRAWENPEAIEHLPLAVGLLEGKGFVFRDWYYYGPSSVQSPPYPLLLAAIFWLFGTASTASFVVALMLNAVVGAATAMCAVPMALAMGARRSVAILGGLLIAIWPTQVYAVTHAQAIPLITLAVVVILWQFVIAVRTGRWSAWIVLSVVGCVAMLTEPVLLPPMALTGLLIFVWPCALSFRGRLARAGVLLVCALLILGPWSVRNRMVHGRWVPVKSTFWVNVWKANNDHASGTDRPVMSPELRRALDSVPLDERDDLARGDLDSVRQYDLLTPQQKRELRGQPEAVREDIFRRYATTWIREHPQRYFELCGIRLFKTLWIEWDNPKAYNRVYIAARTTLAVLSLAGLFIAVAMGWRLGYAMVVLGLSLLTYTLTITAARFALPFEPLQLTLMALVLVSLASLLTRKPSRDVTRPGPARGM